MDQDLGPFKIVPEQGGGLFTGSRQSAAGLNRQRWAKITGSAGSNPVRYSWTEQTPQALGFVNADAGLGGTTAKNPVIEPNGNTLSVGNFVKVRAGYYDPTYDWVFFSESGGGSGGGVTTHNLLSTTHPDTAPYTPPVRGDMLAGANSTGLWTRLPVGTDGQVLTADSTKDLGVDYKDIATNTLAAITAGGRLCVAESILSINTASNTSPIVVATNSGHGYASGDYVYVNGVTGNTAANGWWPINVLTATTFELSESIGNGAYVSGGTVARVNPVTAANVSGASQIHYVPYTSGRIGLWNGTTWVLDKFTGVLLDVTALTANSVYDVFVYDIAGAPTLEASTVWTSDTARANVISKQDGVKVKRSDHKRRLIGTIRVNASQLVDYVTNGVGPLTVGVWNLYQRVPIPLVLQENTTEWTPPSSASWRQTNGTANNAIKLVSGDVDTNLHLEAYLCVDYGALAMSYDADFATGIGENSTTINSAQMVNSYSTIQTLSAPFAADVVTNAILQKLVPLGFTTYNWLEQASKTSDPSVTLLITPTSNENRGNTSGEWSESGIIGFVMA